MSKQTFLSGYKQRSKKLLVECAGEAHKSLSPEQRDLVHKDLYGKNEVLEETDSFIDDKLSELRRQVDLMDDDLTSAYYQAVAAERQCPDCEQSKYVTSREFKLMFLRADHFDARDAARRLTKHFREKLEIFGEEKLCCRISQADLNDQDKALIAAGGISVTGATDNYGRLILFQRQQVLLRSPSSVTTVKRVFFYLLQHAAETHEFSQKAGFIAVDFSMGTKTVMAASAVQRFYPAIRMVQRALPLRFAAVHMCYDSLIEHFFLNLLLLIVPSYMKARIQCHHEKTPGKCIAALQAYGIDKNSVPFEEEDGEFRRDLFQNYMEGQRQLEEQNCKTG